MSEPPIKSFLETSAFYEEARANPYPILKRLREQCPVFNDEAAKALFLTRYDDVRTTVNDRGLWRHPKLAEQGSAAQVQLTEVEGLNSTFAEAESILFLDEPDHSRIRLPLAKALYARVAKLRPQIEAIVGRVLDGIAPASRFDLMAEFAIPIPILVIARILGVDEDRLVEFRRWSEETILSLNPLRSEEETKRMVAGSNALEEYFRELIEARSASPRDDLVSDMVALRREGADISDAELNVNLSSLLVGGNLTTTDLIGNGVWLLLNHPDELAKLKRDPSLAAGAVEEILRFESPVDATSRVSSGDRNVGGCPVHAHKALFLSLRAANRDPGAFEDPDRFDITRRHVSHVAFGGGAHMCIGAPLARVEAQVALTRLFSRFPELKLAEQAIEWRMLPFFRGLKALIVET